MNGNGLASEVLKWMDKLPSSITTGPPPAIAIAEAFADLKNWSRLKRWTRNGSWGAGEYLRLAYQAYGSRQSRQSAADAVTGVTTNMPRCEMSSSTAFRRLGAPNPRTPLELAAT